MRIKPASDLWYDSGKGKLYCATPPRKGIEERLLNILKTMVDALGLSIVISSVDTGSHVLGSRHYSGRAVDVSDAHVYGQGPYPVTINNPHAVACARWAQEYGFVLGRENGPYDAFLLGPVKTRWNLTAVNHSDHFHISIHA